MRACVGRKGGPRLRSRASSCRASQANGHRPFAQGEARKARARMESQSQVPFRGVRFQSVESGQRSTDRIQGVRRRGSGEGSWRYHGSAGLGCSVAPVGGEGLRQTRCESDTRYPSRRCRVAGAQRDKSRLKRIHRLVVQSRNLRMMVSFSARHRSFQNYK